MKKLIIGVLIGIVIAVPVSVSADYIVKGLPWTNVIYRNGSKDGEISVFDDANNKCYIVKEHVYGGTHSSISCVKN